jgi:hypothetical protein
MLVFIFMNVTNAKHELSHCRVIVVFIAVTGQLNVHQYKQAKIVAE